MTTRAAPVRLGRIVAAGLAIHVVVQLVLVALIVVSADPTLGLVAQNPAEAAQVSHLFVSAASWVVPAMTALLTVSAAALVAHSAPPAAALLHGSLVGLVAALVYLTFGGLNPATLAACALLLAAGWLGGRLGGALSLRHA